MQLITKHFPDAVPGMEQAERRKLLFSVSGSRSPRSPRSPSLVTAT